MAFSRKSARKSVAAAGVAIAAAVSAAPANAAIVYSGVLNDTPDAITPSIAYEALGVDFYFTVTSGKGGENRFFIQNSPTPGDFNAAGDVGFSSQILAAGAEVTGFGGNSFPGSFAFPYGFAGGPNSKDGESIFGIGEGGFLAFSVQSKSGGGTPNFGWLQFASEAGSGEGVLVDFAYETVAGQSILAGDIGAATVPLPATSLLLLSGIAGLAGVGARRRKAKKADASEK